MQPQPPDPGADDRATPSPTGPDESLLPRHVAAWRPGQPPQQLIPPPGSPQSPPSAPRPATPARPAAPPQPWQREAPGQLLPGEEPPGQQPPGHPFGQAPRRARDDTTRYLCAAAHLSADFADHAVREFLVEPTRPVPPSPGMDAAAVLNEAVAARTRRKLRDVAMIVLALPLLFLAPRVAVIAWVVLSVVLLLARPSDRGVRAMLPRRYAMLAGVAVGIALLVILLVNLSGLTGDPLNGGLNEYGYLGDYGLPKQDHTVRYVFAVLLLAAMLWILAADRIAVWSLLTRRFQRGAGATGYDTGDRQIHSFSSARLKEQVNRFRLARGKGGTSGRDLPLIVYRGYSPFVGAGRELNAWSTATALRPLSDDERDDEDGPDGERGGSGDPPAEPLPLATPAVYERVERELADLSRATPLTPGRRLGQLRVFGQVIVSAHELVDHPEDPGARTYLPNLGSAPATQVPGDAAERLKADPAEWARYYLCLQVETWDRDLVVSVYLHMAVDENTLYVEWTPCVLMPIDRRYQQIDSLPGSLWPPFGQAVLDLLALPASLPGRLVHAFSSIRPLPRDRGQPNPDRYGSLQSLRELAADPDVHNYFQQADVDRYLKILESRFILAVGRVLREFGYSSAEFDQQAATVVNNSVFVGSNFNAPVVTGGRIRGNVSSSGSMTVTAAAGSRK